MKKGNDDCNMIWRDLFRIVDNIRVRNSDNKDKRFFSLTFNQLRMIHRVYTWQEEHGEQGISLKALAVRLGITSAAASEMVDTLVRKSVLKRSVDAADRRAISIVVSDELKNHFKARENEYRESCAEFLDSLSEEERGFFTLVVGRWAEYVKKNFETDKDGDFGE